jgi:hypothetical protein
MNDIVQITSRILVDVCLLPLASSVDPVALEVLGTDKIAEFDKQSRSWTQLIHKLFSRNAGHCAL